MTAKSAKPKAKLLTLEEAKGLVGRMVYGLCDEGGNIFYVGQTRSAKGRFAAHRQITTKNAGLKAKMKDIGDRVRVVVIEKNPADLNEAERRAIAAHKHVSVNLIGGDHWSWERNSSTPWAAGTGVFAPSSYALKVAPPEAKKEVRGLIARMTPAQRCIFEIQLLQDFPPITQQRFDKWLSVAGPKILALLENESNACAL